MPVTMLPAMEKVLTPERRKKLRGRTSAGRVAIRPGESMMRRFRFPKARMRSRRGARDQLDSSPMLDEAPRPTQQQFHAWAATVRASMETIEALAEEIGERHRALTDLLRRPTTLDPAAIDRLILEMQGRRTEMQRIIDALPALDEMTEAGESGRPGSALRQPAGKRGCVLHAP